MLDCEDNIGVALLSLDYSKAFDTISHRILLRKLNNYGLPSEFIEWTASYLRDRHQSVRIGNCISEPILVRSGVPQGSIVGPVLFILYTADLISPTTENYVKYADDTMILQPINRDKHKSMSFLYDCLCEIQRNSDAICLKLNIEKSKLIVFPKTRNQTAEMECMLLPNITKVTEIKILGVTLSAYLNWDPHIKDILKKCNSRLYALRVLRSIVPEPVLIQTYHGIILTLIDYGSAVFVSLPSYLQQQLHCFTKRCHRIIHGGDCKCNVFENVNTRRVRLACRLFKSAEVERSHPFA